MPEATLLAFEMLYRRHRGTLYRLLLRTLRHRADTDELFQETWSTAHRARASVIGPTRNSRRGCCRSRTISSSIASRRQRPQASEEETAEAVFRKLDAPESDETC